MNQKTAHIHAMKALLAEHGIEDVALVSGRRRHALLAFRVRGRLVKHCFPHSASDYRSLKNNLATLRNRIRKALSS